MDKTKVILISAGSVIITVLVVAGVAGAHGFDFMTRNYFDRGVYNMAREAVINHDFSAWQKVVADRPIAEIIDSPEKFNKMVEMNKLMREGQFSQARNIRQELNLPVHRHKNCREHQELRKDTKHNWIMRENHEAVKQALEDNDYFAWQKAVGNKPIAEKINQENFSKLVEMYNLHKQTRQIADDLGLEHINIFK